MAHIVTWRKQGVEAPVFILFDGYPPRIDSSYQGRLKAVGPASIELSDVRVVDQGWYECTVLYVDRPEQPTDNATWIYLAVNGNHTHGTSLNHTLLVSKKCAVPKHRHSTFLESL